MMDLPYHLKTLEPLTGALEILRYLASLEDPSADADEICDALDLSERTFGKAIRRLVTKNYVQMDGSLYYRLTRQGEEAARDLVQYDTTTPEENKGKRSTSSLLKRRLVVVVPSPLLYHHTNPIIVGLDGATDEDTKGLYSPAEMVVRVSIVNGEPEKPQETVLQLQNEPVKSSFNVTPGAYQEARLRVEVFQLGPNPDDVTASGGLYIDTPIAVQNGDDSTGTAHPVHIAYGADIAIQVQQ
jgi:DNA-binding MarR family transcriptional regulator